MNDPFLFFFVRVTQCLFFLHMCFPSGVMRQFGLPNCEVRQFAYISERCLSGADGQSEKCKFEIRLNVFAQKEVLSTEIGLDIFEMIFTSHLVAGSHLNFLQISGAERPMDATAKQRRMEQVRQKDRSKRPKLRPYGPEALLKETRWKRMGFLSLFFWEHQQI